MLKMRDTDLKGKRVIIRADLNVPLENGRILNDARLRAILPTLNLARERGARVLLLSHLGRPKEGKYDPAYSLNIVAPALSKLLDVPIRFEADWLKPLQIQRGEIVLGENVRFNLGEEANDPALSKKMAALCDVFVMDAFATAHRAQASTVGIAEYAPLAVAGPLLVKEVEALTAALKNPKRPLVAIVGGAKVSSKLGVLKSLLNQVDYLIVGGGIANTFLIAKGSPIGASLFEANLVSEAAYLLEAFPQKILLPEDVKTTQEIPKNVGDFLSLTSVKIQDLNSIAHDDKIVDIGPKSIARFSKALENAGTILWNGPLGIFEIEAFGAGTEALAFAVAQSSAFSIAGGGETLAAIEKYGVEQGISYISTGGGAFLEYVEGKTLPGVAVLERFIKN